MRKWQTALVFLLAAPCVAGSQNAKLDKFLPPRESHGMTVTGYGCDRVFVANSPSTSKSLSFWSLVLWAQYGKDHKKYWQKTYHTYEIPVKTSVRSNGETAGGGDAIGEFELKSYDFTTLDKACADWDAEVRSTLKVDLDAGEKPKQ